MTLGSECDGGHFSRETNRNLEEDTSGSEKHGLQDVGEKAPLALAEEMMSTLKAARIATSENAENTLYTNHVQGAVKKIEIHSNLWKMDCNMHMASS